MTTLSMSPANEVLDAHEYLERLCRRIRSAIPREIEFSFVGSACRLEAECCRHLGMIVCEMVDVGRRHRFPDGVGRIKIELADNDAATVCRIEDNGRRFADTQASRRIGIVCALAGRLRATLGRSESTGGTIWSITIPHQISKPSVDPQRRVARRAVPAVEFW